MGRQSSPVLGERKTGCENRGKLGHMKEGLQGIAEQLERVRRMCLGMAGVEERLSHGEPTFFVGGRVFAMFAGNHHGDGHVGVWLPVPEGEQERLLRESAERYYFPPYVGKGGWVGVELGAVGDDELGERLSVAWQMIREKGQRRKR